MQKIHLCRGRLESSTGYSFLLSSTSLLLFPFKAFLSINLNQLSFENEITPLLFLFYFLFSLDGSCLFVLHRSPSTRFESLKPTDFFPTQKTDRAPQTLSVFLLRMCGILHFLGDSLMNRKILEKVYLEVGSVMLSILR